MHLFRIIITYTIPTKVLPGLHVTQNCTVMSFNVCLMLEQIPKKKCQIKANLQLLDNFFYLETEISANNEKKDYSFIC